MCQSGQFSDLLFDKAVQGSVNDTGDDRDAFGRAAGIDIAGELVALVGRLVLADDADLLEAGQPGLPEFSPASGGSDRPVSSRSRR
jgi:hypothetical protein